MTEQTTQESLNAKCDNCGIVLESTHSSFNDKNYCEDCFSELFFTCEHCNNIFKQDDLNAFNDTFYCYSCFCSQTLCCENCGDRIYRADSIDSLCQSCYEEQEQQDEEVNEILLDFEKIQSKTFNQNPFKNFCGVEIETQNNHISENEFNSTSLKKYGFSQLQDGSLENGGAEYSSLAFNGDLLFDKIKTFCDELEKREFYINSSCGLHIHIGIKKDLEYIKKIFLFYSKYEDYFFKMVSPSRQDNKYCYSLNKLFRISTDDILNLKSMFELKKVLYQLRTTRDIKRCTKNKYNDKRYYWINFHSIFLRKTLEIRLHNGTINPDKINNWFKIHLNILNLIDKLDIEFIKSFPVTEEFFLSMFNKEIQTYIKSRWEKFKKDKESLD